MAFRQKIALFIVSILVFIPSYSYASGKILSVAVRVSEAAESAVKAKDIAFETAMTNALDRVIEAYTEKTQRKRLPEASFSRASKILHSLTVKSEVMTHNNYSALYYVHFDRQKIRSYFQSHGVRLLDRKSPAMVILPLFEKADGKYSALKRRDPLYHSIENRIKANMLMTIRPPSQVISDRSLRPQDLLSLEKYTVNELKLRYQARHVIIALIKLDEEGQPSHFSLVGEDSLGKINHNIDVDADNRRIITNMWDRFMSELLEQLEDRWKIAYSKRGDEFYGSGARDITNDVKSSSNHDLYDIDEIETGSIRSESIDGQEESVEQEIERWIKEAEENISIPDDIISE